MNAPARAELVGLIRSSTEAEILELVPQLGREHLEIIHEELAPEECDCPRQPLPCECGLIRYGLAVLRWCGDRLVGDLSGQRCPENDPSDAGGGVTFDPQRCPECRDEPDWAACPHTKNYYLSWPVLILLEQLLNADPPPPLVADAALSQSARAVVLAKRHAGGKKKCVGLWHPGDAIHQDITSEVNDRLERTAYTLSGWKAAGKPNDLAKAPPANGAAVAGLLRARNESRRRKAQMLRASAEAALKLRAERQQHLPPAAAA